MELIENLLQLLTTFLGAVLSGIAWQKSRSQAYFLLLCFYGCFALGSLYWTLYLLLFNTTPRVFYVSEFGWVASVIFLRILQVTLTDSGERGFRCRKAWLAPLGGVPLLVFYCTYGDVLSNLIWCGLMIWLSFCAVRGLFYANTLTGKARIRRYFCPAARARARFLPPPARCARRVRRQSYSESIAPREYRNPVRRHTNSPPQFRARGFHIDCCESRDR